MQATDDNQAPAKAKREPLQGQALLDFVAKLVLKSYSAAAIAQKASIPYAHARKLKEELLRAACDSIDLSPEEKELWKRENAEFLRFARDSSVDAYRSSVVRGEPNARQLNVGVSAGKILNTMFGFDAPTKSISEHRILAQFLPEEKRRVFENPRARALMLELEEIASEANYAEATRDDIVVGPRPEGGDE